MESTFTAKRIVIISAEGERVLVFELKIECDLCGLTEGTIHGHHLRTLHKALGQAIEAYPDLCGTVGDSRDTTQFQTWCTAKPENN